MSEVQKYEIDEEVENIFQYYKKNPLKNPVYKFSFDFHILLNGQIFDNPNVLFTPEDSIEIRWQVSERKRMSSVDYFNYLFEAYKNEEIVSSYRYRGLWML